MSGEPNRSGLLVACAAALSVFAGLANAAPGPADDMSLGNPTAPVTVIEYASVGCPHCGLWAREVFPAFKKTYVDTGKVRFVLREMLYGNPPLAMMGFLTARCAGKARYFQVVDGIFAAQPEMEAAGDALPSLIRVAKDAGLSQTQFAACVADPAAQQALQARSDGYGARDHITGTPTFVVGDKTIDGEISLADLSVAIAAASRGRSH